MQTLQVSENFWVTSVLGVRKCVIPFVVYVFWDTTAEVAQSYYSSLIVTNFISQKSQKKSHSI